MKKLVTILSVAATVAGSLAWLEEHSRRPGSELLAVQLKKDHVLLGMFAGLLTLVG